jgi:hypothetical protein
MSPKALKVGGVWEEVFLSSGGIRNTWLPCGTGHRQHAGDSGYLCSNGIKFKKQGSRVTGGHRAMAGSPLGVKGAQSTLSSFKGAGKDLGIHLAPHGLPNLDFFALSTLKLSANVPG